MNNLNNRGEQLSFYELFDEKKWNIKIPIIQRDYAQGRDSVKEIRELFLDNLHKHLIINKNIDLDFIYGSIDNFNNDNFIPLDGQQRLTTLFLLHWYLSIKDNQKRKFKNFMVDNDNNMEISRFSYETRSSAREFCDSLVVSDINLDYLIDKSISKTIKNKAWYFGVWENDPTINSMLTMLDDIHKKFNNTNGLFDRLIDQENPVITFQFLNLEEFNLTDDLYIKMNARGKQLTPFENFKAKFEQFIKNLNLNTYVLETHTGRENVKMDLSKYFSHKIDTVWADLFWTYRNVNSQDNSFDDELMNFIRVIFTNQYAEYCSNPKEDINLDILLDTLVAKRRKDYKKNISYHRYEQMGALNKESVLYLINALDSIKYNGNGLNQFFSNDYFYYDEEKMFKKVLDNNLNFSDRVKFHAYLKFIVNNQNNTDGLKQWIRVISNLVDNSIFDGADDFSRAIRSVNKIIPNCSEILNYLKNKNNEVDFFYSRQVEEERIKSHLIKRSEQWEKEITQIEENNYFDGQIGFIFEFSGILSFFRSHQNCNWDHLENKKYFNKFKAYCLKVNAITPLLVKENSKFDYIWERAVLSKGDYLIETTASRKNLLSSKRNMRDFSWKRLLRLPPAVSDSKEKWKKKRNYVRKVLEDKRFDVYNVKESLSKICEDKVSSWRKHFIKNPKVIDYCKQGYINYKSPKNILLFKQSQLNHYHAELYSYLFYNKYLEKEKFHPFERTFYNYVKTRNEHSCAVIDKWFYEEANYAMDIRFLHDKKEYEISFFDRNLNDVPKIIGYILEKYQFRNTNKYEYTSKIANFGNQDQTIKMIKVLSNDFAQL